MRRRSRHGFSLVEPVIALTVLGLAGAGWMGLLTQSRASSAAVNRVEREHRGAATVMAGLARESREEIVRQAGLRTVGEYDVLVAQREDVLFDVKIALSETGALLLQTTLYRRREAVGDR